MKKENNKSKMLNNEYENEDYKKAMECYKIRSLSLCQVYLILNIVQLILAIFFVRWHINVLPLLIMDFSYFVYIGYLNGLNDEKLTRYIKLKYPKIYYKHLTSSDILREDTVIKEIPNFKGKDEMAYRLLKCQRYLWYMIPLLLLTYLLKGLFFSYVLH